MMEHCIPFVPVTTAWTVWTSGDTIHSRQSGLHNALPFSLAIQKTVGQTLDKAVIDLSKIEEAPGSTFVAIPRVQCLEDCLIQPMTLQQLLSISRGMQFRERLLEELWY